MLTPINLVRRTVLLWLAACATCLAAATPAAAEAVACDLPAGINQSLHDAGRPLVTVIAADIDADGDLDVVATDRSLNLLVWVNDGTGQFTRKRPAPAHEGRTGAPGPGLDNRGPFSNEYTSSDPPSVDANDRTAIAAPFVVVTRNTRTPDRGRDRTRSTRRPRGPPSTSSLN